MFSQMQSLPTASHGCAHSTAGYRLFSFRLRFGWCSRCGAFGAARKGEPMVWIRPGTDPDSAKAAEEQIIDLVRSLR